MSGQRDDRSGGVSAEAAPTVGRGTRDARWGEERRRDRFAQPLRRLWGAWVTPALPHRGAAPPSPRPGPEPRRAGWTRILGVCVAGFALWLVLDAPTLQHNAQVSPVGARRTVSLDILRPIAALSRDLGLSHVVSVADGVLGRSGNPGLTAPPPIHRHRGAGALSTPTTTLPLVTMDHHPSPGNPLRVLVVGDSLGIDLGDVLVNDLTQTGVVQATLDGQVATGLTRPDYFNWPGELSADLPRYTPQVVVVMIGANDAQDLPGPPDVPFGTPTWVATYRSRVNAFMEEATSHGARLIWVGMPPMQNPGLSADMQTIDSIVQDAVRTHPGVEYVSSWTTLGTPSGQFTAYLVENGQEVNVREPDGTHIAPGGAQLLAQAVENVMHSDLAIEF